MSASAEASRGASAFGTPRGLVDVAVVTGIHRSGTTFLANLLGAAHGTRLLGREPLNRHWGVVGVETWYPVLRSPEQGGTTTGSTEDALLRLRRGRPVRWQHPQGGVRQLGATIEQNALVSRARLSGDVLVLKDPFLALSLPFVHRWMTVRPIVLAVRHPSAWTMSLARVQWHPGWLVDRLRQRPELAEVVERLKVPNVHWQDSPLVEASAWAWTILMDSIREQVAQLRRGSVVVVVLESMRDDPQAVAHDLIRSVGLTPDAHTARRITTLTEGSVVAPQSTRQHVLERNTRASVDAWRTRLDRADQATIWAISGPTATSFGYAP